MGGSDLWFNTLPLDHGDTNTSVIVYKVVVKHGGGGVVNLDWVKQ